MLVQLSSIVIGKVKIVLLDFGVKRMFNFLGFGVIQVLLSKNVEIDYIW